MSAYHEREKKMKKTMLVLLVAGLCFGCKPGETEWEKAPLNLVSQAAEEGNAQAQLVLGNMYEQGRGVEQSSDMAAEWIRKAADQESFLAQLQLAKMYFDGRGVPQDYSEAFSWLMSAVNLGKARAEEQEQAE